MHEGVTYRFVSAKNRDLFHANAGKYEPADIIAAVQRAKAAK